jgi:hypothetical protein
MDQWAAPLIRADGRQPRLRRAQLGFDLVRVLPTRIESAVSPLNRRKLRFAFNNYYNKYSSATPP